MKTGLPITVYFWLPAETGRANDGFSAADPKAQIDLPVRVTDWQRALIIRQPVPGRYCAHHRPPGMVRLGQRGIEENRRLLACLTGDRAIHLQHALEKDIPKLLGGLQHDFRGVQAGKLVITAQPGDQQSDFLNPPLQADRPFLHQRAARLWPSRAGRGSPAAATLSAAGGFRSSSGRR